MDTLVSFFKAMSDETRLRLLVLLYSQDLCVCELTDTLQLSQPKVSKHLSKLRDLGFVDTRKDSRFVYYYLSVDDATILAFLKAIDDSIENYDVLKSDRDIVSQCRREI